MCFYLFFWRGAETKAVCALLKTHCYTGMVTRHMCHIYNMQNISHGALHHLELTLLTALALRCLPSMQSRPEEDAVDQRDPAGDGCFCRAGVDRAGRPEPRGRQQRDGPHTAHQLLGCKSPVVRSVIQTASVFGSVS